MCRVHKDCLCASESLVHPWPDCFLPLSVRSLGKQAAAVQHGCTEPSYMDSALLEGLHQSRWGWAESSMVFWLSLGDVISGRVELGVSKPSLIGVILRNNRAYEWCQLFKMISSSFSFSDHHPPLPADKTALLFEEHCKETKIICMGLYSTRLFSLQSTLTGWAQSQV